MPSTTAATTLVRAIRRLPPSHSTNRLGRLCSIALGAAGVNVITPVSMRDGTRMLLDTRGRTESEAVWTGGFDEGLKAYLLAAAAVTGPSFVDVGANVGLIAVPMARALAPHDGRVLAIEPVAANLERLQASAQLNGLRNLGTVACAVGAEPGSVTLTREAAFGQTSGNAVIDTGTPVVRRGVQTASVPVRTLDEILDEAGGEWNVVKIDCEGFDVNVIKGAARLLQEQRPIVWAEFASGLTERFGLGVGQLAGQLSEARYSVFVFEDVYRMRRVEPVDGVGNATLVPDELVEPLLAELENRRRSAG